VWRCQSCIGPVDLESWSEPHGPVPEGIGFGRFRRWLPAAEPVSIGEVTTALVPFTWPPGSSTEVLLKTEGSLPTGSFKDRGSSFLVGRLRSDGVAGITVDSSGNAGASIAAYGAAAGLRVRVYVPASASTAKLAQIRAYGAEVVAVEGTRQAVGEAAVAAATDEFVYASHVWSPYFIVGTQTFAFDVFEQLGLRAPDAIVCPLGAGTLLLGSYYAFRGLVDAGLCERMPALYGVQTVRCAPLARAWSKTRAVESGDCSASIAEGILIASPPRAKAVLEAVRETRGAVVAVEEHEIRSAVLALARRGVYAEPTAAVSAAALDRVSREVGGEGDAVVVAAITATGLKASGLIDELLTSAEAQ
jgi:threonine synthase